MQKMAKIWNLQFLTMARMNRGQGVTDEPLQNVTTVFGDTSMFLSNH
jgi:hypothetical protein